MVKYLGDLDSIRIKFFKEKFVNELESLKCDLEAVEEDSNSDENSSVEGEDHTNWLRERIKNLEDIIAMVDKGEENSNKLKKNKLEVDFDEINNYVYRKTWNRLPNFHKVVKIKEYIKELVNDEKTQNEIVKLLSKYVEEKKINTKKFVDYDSKDCKIVELKFFNYNEEDGTYEITLNKKKK